MNQIDQKIKKARARLLLDYPFYGALAIRLDMIPAKQAGKYQIETATTDGKSIYYNELYIDTLTHSELIFLIAHEISHCLLKHHTRRAGRDAKLWNMAGDHAINLLLESEQIGTVIKGALIDQNFQDMSTEQIYKILQDQGGQNKSQSDTDNNTIDDPCGGVIDAPKNGIPADLESNLKESSQNALHHATRAGKEPGQAIQNLVKNLIAPRADWKELLKNWLASNDQSDFSFTRPSRRSSDYIMPGLYNESLGKLIIAIDTSGSVLNYQGAVNAFQTEINSLRRSHQSEVELIYFHSGIYKIENYQAGQNIKIDITETGGTRIKPVFDHVKASGQISGLIIFTDMEIFDFPRAAPRYPVLWLQYGGIGYKTDIGRTVKIN